MALQGHHAIPGAGRDPRSQRRLLGQDRSRKLVGSLSDASVTLPLFSSVISVFRIGSGKFHVHA